jgi:hypothetical protein
MAIDLLHWHATPNINLKHNSENNESHGPNKWLVAFLILTC